METFIYNIDEVQCFKFKPSLRGGFELYHKMEGSSSRSLGTYNGGMWTWEEKEQQTLFFEMLKVNGKKMQRAFKAYYRQKPEQTMEMTISCAKRKLNIKYNKFTDKLQSKLIETFYGNHRNY